ncbi:MAG: GTPase Era [Deltaproteobacteria bacterium]|nr:MAG: GTPase Era [Deltaproteobacteria bacterium]
MSEPGHRSGVAALLGAPNAGKSTLLNRLIGEKLAIVTPKPQTTRSRILGILTLPGAQVLLLDTPGLHAGTSPLNVALNAQVVEAVGDCDVAVLLVDLTRGWGEGYDALLRELEARAVPILLVGTKCDHAKASREDPWPPHAAAAAAWVARISARTGQGVDALLKALVARLPEGPPYYPDDEITDRPLRFLTAEIVREAASMELQQELPHRIAVEVVEFDESRPERVRIRANLLVERDSQKRIAVGRGGDKIKRIGTAARRSIERLLGRPVHLELWVKVDPDWARRPKRLKSLGYY